MGRKIESVVSRLFEVPLEEPLVDAKHGTHTYFHLITTTITLSDGNYGTGYTYTGGRVLRLKKYLKNETFLLTYGDGVSNVNIKELLKFHISNNKACTLTAVKPEPRFGALILEDNMVKHFREKDLIDVDWINGGYFVCEQSIFNYIKNGDKEVWEQAPLEGLSNSKNLTAFKHIDFWKPMDTLKDTIELNEMWDKNNAKWKIW